MPLLMVMEVFLLDPSSRFVIVSFPGPLPQHLKDGTVYILKDFFAHHMLMIPCPSSNERVEQQDQVTSSGSLMVLDHFSGFIQERATVPHVLIHQGSDSQVRVNLAPPAGFLLRFGRRYACRCSLPSAIYGECSYPLGCEPLTMDDRFRRNNF